ncbi:alpha/beta hydrolase [Methylobacterium sp. J-068]|uniref:alpha/beta hydrolase n=1 Tax=Methylobacterium sp. J-068 TaxID=2836649 RepID=UPI001FBA6739|nr:alpha/beta hydrolase-fold protein [Methylobacterium sp. J-068]MCJ2033582.1 alpha/beta hydrolase-fold protein [Methylobacterium sp. J-068]
MRAGISRRTFAGLLSTSGLILANHSVAAETDTDEPARLAGAISFDYGGNRERTPWRITLYVPPGDAPASGWPVLYLLDGNAVTATVIDIERVQAPYPNATGIGSRFAIVGIGYPGDEAYDGLRRSWDYTPPPGQSYPPYKPGGPTLRTGGAKDFLRFVVTELRPAIERRIQVDPARQALFGHSFGGLFVLYALANAPTAFSHWIAASPSVYWEDLVLLKSIVVLENGPPVHANVLIVAGAYEEDLAPFQRDASDREARLSRLKSTRTVELSREMADRLARISGLTSQFRLIPERTHMSILPEAVNDAVAFFLK